MRSKDMTRITYQQHQRETLPSFEKYVQAPAKIDVELLLVVVLSATVAVICSILFVVHVQIRTKLIFTSTVVLDFNFSPKGFLVAIR